jgi:hypothetical protein
MNTRTIIDLSKSLRAFSVFFVSLGLLVLVPTTMSYCLCDYARGVDAITPGWLVRIQSAIIFVLAGMILLCCYLVARREKRGVLATVLLWGTTLGAGVYAAMFTCGFLHWMLALFHVA